MPSSRPVNSQGRPASTTPTISNPTSTVAAASSSGTQDLSSSSPGEANNKAPSGAVAAGSSSGLLDLSSPLFPGLISLIPRAPPSEAHYMELTSFRHFELPEILPDGRPCRYMVPHNAKGSQVLRPFTFAPSTNSDQSMVEAEHGGLPIALCLGNCGNSPCCERLQVAADIQRALRNRDNRSKTGAVEVAY